jgi:hypothetical protein
LKQIGPPICSSRADPVASHIYKLNCAQFRFADRPNRDRDAPASRESRNRPLHSSEQKGRTTYTPEHPGLAIPLPRKTRNRAWGVRYSAHFQRFPRLKKFESKNEPPAARNRTKSEPPLIINGPKRTKNEPKADQNRTGPGAIPNQNRLTRCKHAKPFQKKGRANPLVFSSEALNKKRNKLS